MVMYRDIAPPELVPADAVEHLRTWFGDLGGNSLIALFRLPMRHTTILTLDELIGHLSESSASLDHFVMREVGAESVKIENVYVHCATVQRRTLPRLTYRANNGEERSHQVRRPRIQDMGRSPGLWLELDVKEGSFASYDECLDVVYQLEAVGLRPCLLVRSGGGGLHVYFAVAGGLDALAAAALSARLRIWVQVITGRKLDDVAQANRVLRVAGTWWSKKGEVLVREVALVRADRGVYVSVDNVLSVTEATWAAETTRLEAEKERVAAQRRERSARLSADLADAAGSGRGWVSPELMTWSELERWTFISQEWADGVTWDDLLLPWGFTLAAEADREGRRVWTRPWDGVGREPNPRSLSTDYDGSASNPAVLYSGDTSTPEMAALHAASWETRTASGDLRVIDKLSAAAALWGIDPVVILRCAYLGTDWTDEADAEGARL